MFHRLIIACLAVLFVAGAVALVSGCGPDAPSGVRVHLLIPEGDVMPESAFYVISMQARRGEERLRVKLEPVAGEPRGVMVAPGAPDGVYAIQSDGPWRMLLTTKRPPTLTASGTPVEIPMGPGLSIFIGARDQAAGRVGSAWRVERELAGGRWERVAAEVRPTFRETVMVRLKKSDWYGRARVTGTMADGTPVRPIPLLLDSLDPDDAQLRLVIPAPRAAVAVLPVGFGGGNSPRVQVKLMGSGFRETYTSAVEDGMAVVEAVPELAAAIRVTFPGGDPESKWDISDREREGLAWTVLLDLGVNATDALWVPLDLPEGMEVARVLVRPATATAFARAAVRLTDTGPEVRTLPRAQTWWVESAAGTWVRRALETLPARVDLREAAALKGARVYGQVRADAAGLRPLTSKGWRVVAELHEGDETLVLDRAVSVLQHDDRYSIKLPPGTWTLRPFGPKDESAPAIKLELGPGALRRQPLSAR